MRRTIVHECICFFKMSVHYLNSVSHPRARRLKCIHVKSFLRDLNDIVVKLTITNITENNIFKGLTIILVSYFITI